MSSKEARRPGLVQAALAGKVTNLEAATALGLSVRQFRRLKRAYERRGVGGLLHGNRGRVSPRRLSDADREQIVVWINGRYAGLNDTHLTEKLNELEHLAVSRETVRQLRIEAGIAPVRRRRAPKHRTRRLRCAREGALVLIDGSNHLWLEDRGPRATLLGAMDDATGKILALHFRLHEDLHGHTELLQQLIGTHGLPCNLYGDRLAVFVRTDAHWTLDEELAGCQNPTAFGQMLAELAIGYIAAHSPQAKGRIERLWETLQDRLVSELRLRGITTLEAAAAFLPEFIADYNQRFALPARDTTRAWRAAPRALRHVLACRYSRIVARDNTVTLPGRWIQLPPRARGRSWQGRMVEVRELLDGRVHVFYQQQLIAEQAWPLSTFTLVPRDNTPVARRRELGIDLLGSSRIDQPLTARVRSRSRKRGIGQYTHVRRPDTKHPWARTKTLNLPPRAARAGGT